MKTLIYILSILFVFAACSKNTSHREENTELDQYTGVYEYVYLDNVHDVIESYYIVLTKENNQLKGRYYGTSTDFGTLFNDEPGYFVTLMNDIEITKQSLHFSLQVGDSDCMTKAIDLKIASTQEALDAGYKNWNNNLKSFSKTIDGQFQDNSIVVGNTEEGLPDKLFVKIK